MSVIPNRHAVHVLRANAIGEICNGKFPDEFQNTVRETQRASRRAMSRRHRGE